MDTDAAEQSWRQLKSQPENIGIMVAQIDKTVSTLP
jgi:hypothetical protein